MESLVAYMPDQPRSQGLLLLGTLGMKLHAKCVLQLFENYNCTCDFPFIILQCVTSCKQKYPSFRDRGSLSSFKTNFRLTN